MAGCIIRLKQRKQIALYFISDEQIARPYIQHPNGITNLTRAHFDEPDVPDLHERTLRYEYGRHGPTGDGVDPRKEVPTATKLPEGLTTCRIKAVRRKRRGHRPVYLTTVDDQSYRSRVRRTNGLSERPRA